MNPELPTTADQVGSDMWDRGGFRYVGRDTQDGRPDAKAPLSWPQADGLVVPVFDRRLQFGANP